MTSEVSQEVEVAPSELGASLCGLRLCLPNAQEQMELSFSRVGQLTPLQAWRAPSRLELFDGLKRLRAAQALSWPKLRVEVHALESAGAKVRLLLCNAAAGLSDLEEAWVVRSLYRDEKLTQPQIAQLLGRHKSWVCRRLTLAEELSDEVTAQVRLGLVCVRAAVELARLPRGNQDAAAMAVMRRGLTTRQTATLVDRLLQVSEEQWGALLSSAALPAASPEPKGGAPRRTPGEQLVADAWAMKRLSARMHARLLERSLSSLGAESYAVVRGELAELRGALRALTETLDLRLSSREKADAAA
jgi:ParB-like chromosome segregation protein Spo0J